MSYIPVNIDLTVDNGILQGATFYRTFSLTTGGSPVDLTAWTGASKGIRCQMRASIASGTIVATPVMAVVGPATDGVFSMTMTAATTTALGAVTSGVYDIELFDESGGTHLVERIVFGEWDLSLEVTR